MKTITHDEFTKRFEAAGDRVGTGADMRSGEAWDAFCKQRRIRAIRTLSPRRHEVDSESGHVYTVEIVNRRDGDGMYMTCTCPARGDCRHRAAVYDALMAEAVAAEDYDTADWLERVL